MTASHMCVYYAFILTKRTRYDRVSYVRVLRSETHQSANGYQITYNKIGDKGKVKIVTEFIPDKWIVHMYEYQS